jgi:hypothetical protein
MQYQILGKMIHNTEIARLSHEDFVEIMQSKFLPTLHLLLESGAHGKVLAGGMPPGSRDITMIVDFKTRGNAQANPGLRRLSKSRVRTC